MTQCWLGAFSSCLFAIASVGCQLADRSPSTSVWQDEVATAPDRTPVASPPAVERATPPTIKPVPSASFASVRPIAFDLAEGTEEIVAPPPSAGFELLGAPPAADAPFEMIDPPAAELACAPPYDFLDTLSPGARCFLDEGVTGCEASHWAVVRHHCIEDLCNGWQRVKRDYRNFYTWDGLGYMAVGFGIGAAIANTNADEQIQDWYRDDVRTDLSNDCSRWVKFAGEGWVAVSIAGAGWAAGELFYDSPAAGAFGEWGGRTIRGMVVGVPPLLLSQVVTGASRPMEHIGSRWHPFEDDNGVSGHAFMGSLSFITAAKMCESWQWKAAFYACSLAPTWSRVNDDSHYVSQAFLGWWMAYWAATAVDLTNREERSNWSVQSMAMGSGSGVSLVYAF
jgi:hypothetical protein